MHDQKLIEQYLKTLDEDPPQGRQREQVVQDFLEAHTEFIPTPNLLNHHLHFKCIISKFRLSTALITDYAYLTKSSDCWRVTFVELESPEKTIFQQSAKKAMKTSAFNNAIDQVRSWKNYVKANTEDVKKRLAPLLRPINMQQNPVTFEYQLIYGRSAEKNLTIERKQEFNSLQQDNDIAILTFDQVKSTYENSIPYVKNVLRGTGSGYDFKSMDAGINSMLMHLGPGELFLTDSQQQALIAQGYDIAAWKRGELLTVNGRHPGNASSAVLANMLGRSASTP